MLSSPCYAKNYASIIDLLGSISPEELQGTADYIYMLFVVGYYAFKITINNISIFS